MMFARKSSSDSDSVQLLAIKNGLIPNVKGSIAFTTHAVFASQDRILSDSFPAEEIIFCDCPGLLGQHFVAFPVKGQSMFPEIKENEIVIAKRLETSYCGNGKNIKILDDISKNKIYIVRTQKGDAWLKYLEPIKSKLGYVTELRLISENAEHPPFEIKVKDVEIYKVVGHIRSME